MLEPVSAAAFAAAAAAATVVATSAASAAGSATPAARFPATTVQANTARCDATSHGALPAGCRDLSVPLCRAKHHPCTPCRRVRSELWNSEKAQQQDAPPQFTSHAPLDAPADDGICATAELCSGERQENIVGEAVAAEPRRAERTRGAGERAVAVEGVRVRIALHAALCVRWGQG